MHTARMFRKTVLFPPNHLAGPAPASLESGQGAQRRRVPSVAQLMQLLLPPGARPFALAMQSLAQRPHVLAGVVKIQHRHGSRPAIARDVPNPGRAVADPQLLPRAAQSVFARRVMQAAAQFQRFALPTDHHLVRQQPPTVFARRLFLQVKHAGLQFMPFHGGFWRFGPAPAGAALAHLPAVQHQHAQGAGRALRCLFPHRLNQPPLRLFFRARPQLLRQRMQRGVIGAMAQLAQ